ncbi:MAG: class I SAM-dependent methyltransferase [Alphaproteobacteria bacterium]|nr:class I SAM-dependent methyltransferase [Alphaproteobacteria bacterium]
MADKTVVPAAIFFDNFAPHYDNLSEKDGWNAHSHVFNAVERHRMHSPGHRIHLLDLGIGTGKASAHFRKAVNNIHITGIDGSHKMIELCEKQKIANVLIPRNLNSGIPREPNEFDIVISAGVMEYLQDSNAFIKEMARVTKPGGLVCFTTELAPPSESSRVMGTDGRVHVPLGNDLELCMNIINPNETMETLSREGLILLEEPEEFTAYRNNKDGDIRCKLFVAQKPEIEM